MRYRCQGYGKVNIENGVIQALYSHVKVQISVESAKKFSELHLNMQVKGLALRFAGTSYDPDLLKALLHMSSANLKLLACGFLYSDMFWSAMSSKALRRTMNLLCHPFPGGHSDAPS